jgi:endonuclease/exonuclease/phosphatase family metal-dependent hydrolase
MSAQAAAARHPWTLASYNIRSCRGLDRRIDPPRIAAILCELNAGAVALQEVASEPGRANDTRQLDLLAAATGLDAVAGPTLLRPDAPCGTALLTRHPVSRVRRFDLSVSGREPRGALEVDLDVDGSAVRIVNTHLGLRAGERRTQIARLLALLSEATGSPFTVLTGDFNEWWPFSSALNGIRARFRAASAPPTFPSIMPLLALDRMWVSASTPFVLHVSSYKTPLTRISSDHLPLLANLRWVEQTAGGSPGFAAIGEVPFHP